MEQEKKREIAKRTKKRSKPGAQELCPHCGKKLRGGKGAVMHIAMMHPNAPLPKTQESA